MRVPSVLVLTAFWAAAVPAGAQAPTPPSRVAPAGAAMRPVTPASASPARRRSETADAAAVDRSGPARARGLPDPARTRTPAKGQGFLALRTTDITGNKELPKVMVIVPWHRPVDAGGVVKPTDSLMSEALGPVDRGVFQRRIRYYGQLKGNGASPAVGPGAAPASRGRTR
jgi:hypothetical protein